MRQVNIIDKHSWFSALGEIQGIDAMGIRRTCAKARAVGTVRMSTVQVTTSTSIPYSSVGDQCILSPCTTLSLEDVIKQFILCARRAEGRTILFLIIYPTRGVYVAISARSNLLPTVMLHKSTLLWNSPLRYNVTLSSMNQPMMNPSGRPKSLNKRGMIQNPKLCSTGPWTR